MSPEEKSRIIESAFKDSRFLKDLEKSPEEQLSDKLDCLTREARKIMHSQLVLTPFSKDRPLVFAKVCEYYYQCLEPMDKESLTRLLATSLSAQLLQNEA